MSACLMLVRFLTFLLFPVAVLVANADSAIDKIPLGIIFEKQTEEIQQAFKFAMLNHNRDANKKFELLGSVDIINTADVFKLTGLICTRFSNGVASMLGAVSSNAFDTLYSYSNTFHVPFVTPWFPEKLLNTTSDDYAISLWPDYHKAIIDMVLHYRWEKVIYIYDSHDGNFLPGSAMKYTRTVPSFSRCRWCWTLLHHYLFFLLFVKFLR